jgi:hypothetical protein
MKRTFVAVITLMMVIVSASFADNTMYVKDINSDLKVGLEELIVKLQVLSGVKPEYSESITMDSAKIVMVTSNSIIHGTVTQDTGDLEIIKIIPNANVVCTTDKGQEFSVTSDENGFFIIENVPAGTHVVKAFKEGFASSEMIVELGDDQKAELVFKLRINDEKPGGVEGRILTPDANGTLVPVEGATVKLLLAPEDFPVETARSDSGDVTNEDTLKVETDADGHYLIESVKDGRYFVIAGHEGFRLSMSIVAITTGSLSKADLVIFPKNGENFGSLLGTVVEQDNNADSLWPRFTPVQKAIVTLSTEENGAVKEVRKAVTGQKGEFYFMGVPVGSYILEVTHENFEPYQQHVVINNDDPNTLPIIQPLPVEPKPDTDVIDSTVESGGVKISDSTNASAQAQDSASIAKLLSFMSDASNTCFCIGPYGSWVPNATFIKVVLKRSTQEQQSSISGKVVNINADGVAKPIVGAKISVYPYFPYPTFAPLPNFTTISDDTGYYKFDNLPVGYQINGQVIYLISAFAEGFQDMNGRVALKPGTETIFDIKMYQKPALVILKGHVYDGSVKCDDDNKCTQAIKGAVIHLLSDGNVAGNAAIDIKAITDENGLYVFDRLAAGKYKMVVNALGYFPLTDSVGVNADQQNVKDITLMPNTAISVVHGKVTFKADNCNSADCVKPIVGATVVLSPPVYASWSPPLKVITDENGEFVFKEVVAGTYQMLVRAPGLDSWEKSITIEAGKDIVQNVELAAISNAGNLKGTITGSCDSDIKPQTSVPCNNPVPNADIELLPMSYDAAGNIITPIRTKSDANGNYFFESVLPGKYQIRVKAEGYYPHEEYIGIDQNKEMVYNVNLTSVDSWSRLKGTIYLSDINSDGTNVDKRVGVDIPVMLLSSNFQTTFETKSNQNGVYLFENVPPETYVLYVKKEGYLPVEMKVFLPASDEIVQDITLINSTMLTGIKGMVIDGSVRCENDTTTGTDANGNVTTTDANRCIAPIGGAIVTLYAPNGAKYEVRTDNAGLYGIKAPGGEYTIVVNAEGFQPFKEPVKIPYQEVLVKDIPLMPEGEMTFLKGEVTDGMVDCNDTTDCFVPIANAMVTLKPQDETTQPRETSTNERGFYEIPNVYAGKYTLWIGARGYEPNARDIEIKQGENIENMELIPAPICADNAGCSATSYCAKLQGNCKGEGVCLAKPTVCPTIFDQVCGCDGKTYANACVAAESGVNVAFKGACSDIGMVGSLSGKVIDSLQGLPLGGVDVYVIKPSDNNTAKELHVQTDKEGGYNFQVVPVGVYDIIVKYPGYQSFKDKVEITENMETTKDVRLVPIQTISSLTGMVSSCQNNANCGIAKAKVLLISLQDITAGGVMTSELSTETDDSGHYEFKDLTAGAYNIVVNAQGFMEFQETIKILPGIENKKDITLKTVETISSLGGFVYDSSINCDPSTSNCVKGIANAIVRLYPITYNSTDPIAKAVTDDLGKYIMPEVPVGTFRIVVEAEGFIHFEIRITTVDGENTYDVQMVRELTCTDNAGCNRVSFCLKALGQCSETDTGTCQAKPEACVMVSKPVCGCDGKTYGNECIAHGSGVNVAYDGECK